jgi:hypothetical protein
MEIEVKEMKPLEDGIHEGIVTRIEYRTEPFAYTDVYISVSKEGFELRYGCPTSSGTESKLITLLNAFTPIKAGMKVDPEKILIGRKVKFMTMQEKKKTDKGMFTFTRIVDNSVKPA